MQIDKMEHVGETSNFSDAWIFLDGQSYGVYELPRSIPFVSDDPVSVSIQAGIRENGIKSAPRVYPFVDNYEFDLDLEDGEEILVNPVFNYLDNIKIRFDSEFNDLEDFGFDEDGVDSIRIVLAENGVGLMKLEGGQLLEEATALVFNEIPRNGSPVYLEIEYRGNLDLDVGLIGISGSDIFKDYFVSLRSDAEWNKAYINFTDLIIASNLNGYQILLGADNSENTREARIYIDNIKLLHF
jgi:hypothetical protein